MPFRPLRGHFYLYLHSTLILQTIISYCVPPTFVRLRTTSIRLRLRSPSFSGLISHTSTSLPRYFVVLARVSSISLRSRSFFHYIHRTSYTDLPTHLHSLSDHFRVGY